MAEFRPIARSPIAPAAPAVGVAGWEVSSARSDARLRLVDCTSMVKVGVRADPGGALSAAIGAPFGRALRDAEGTLTVGSGPGEWLVLAAPGTAARLLERLRRSAAGEFASVVDLSHARALVRLTGDDAAGVLSKVCAIDLSDETTPDGSALRSSVAKLVTDLVRDDQQGSRSYWLHCEWSSGQYLFDALLDAGAEFGIEVDGFRGWRR